MAGEVFPRAEPRFTRSEAERKVWAALRAQLPDRWRAWHSLRLRTGGSWEGEGDFVLAVPDRGLLVLEVKGGRVELRDGHWYQNERRMERSPRDQAHGFARRLAEAVAERAGEPWPVPYGIACAFPDVEFSAGPTSGDLEGLVLGARQLAWLSEALPAVLERALPDRPAPRSRRWLEVLHELWGETWVPSLCLS